MIASHITKVKLAVSTPLLTTSTCRSFSLVTSIRGSPAGITQYSPLAPSVILRNKEPYGDPKHGGFPKAASTSPTTLATWPSQSRCWLSNRELRKQRVFPYHRKTGRKIIPVKNKGRRTALLCIDVEISRQATKVQIGCRQRLLVSLVLPGSHSRSVSNSSTASQCCGLMLSGIIVILFLGWAIIQLLGCCSDVAIEHNRSYAILS
jgi:hypothetical protein